MGKQQLAVVFDMDECTGSWQYGSILYGIFQYLGVANTPMARQIYLRHIYRKSVRPGFNNCLRKLAEAKQHRRITDVVCYTANTGVGYPEFVKDCYELASRTPGLFTGVFVVHRPGEHGADGGKSIHVLKERLGRCYKYPFKNVIAFDDRPSAWSEDGSRARVVKVEPFTGEPVFNLRNLIFDVVHGFGVQNLNQLLSIRQGDVSYMSNQPNLISTRSLSDLFHDLSYTGTHVTNMDDACCQNIVNPAIKHFIRNNRNATNKKAQSKKSGRPVLVKSKR